MRIKTIDKMNLKNLKNLKKGFTELTQLQLSEGKIEGYIGMVVGLILASITTLLNHAWGLGIFLVFLTWFQVMGLLGELKQRKNLMELEATMKEQDKEFIKAFEEAEKKMEDENNEQERNS